MTENILFDLTTRYTESHRFYHNIKHIADMLHKGRIFSLSDVQIAAIWFHDAIYIPTSKNNELESAKLAGSMLTNAGWPFQKVNLVTNIILDTINHIPNSEEAKQVIDLDLSMLADPYEEYLVHVGNIRREYDDVSEEDWEKGRKDWLHKMLDCKQLFYTQWGAGLEEQARSNLSRELTGN